MRLYDTASRGLVELPEPGERPLGMYVCGPTVYQRIHVGNARPFVVSMWLRRWLAERGYDVTLVENITDINDKIYAAAPGDSARLAADATRWYVEDTDLLGLGRPDHEPLATGTIPEIVSLIEELIELDLAYEAGGDVYFRVDRFEDYGRLSGRHDDESAVRNPSEEEEQSALKENPRDFALWKTHKEGEDTWWESPWGRGRPGWHIECSAMAEKHLGAAFEIHGGGLDLVFPHHENEIAQSRGAGREFARIWMHNGMLRLGGEKMSKSLGNLVPLRDAVEEWGRETILVLFLGAHWRKPMDWSEETLAAAKARAEGFREVFRNPSAPGGSWAELAAALDNDFNTPEALAVMHEWRDHDLLRRALELFGLESLAEEEAAPAELDELAKKRAEARAGGDFDEADRLRQEIEAAGWQVRDVAGDSGYQLVRKR
ncbi:MAG TPA: cysteine--tRNA ligase [Gaiellaceae bacterium]|nr:cysteine--tRNA ligase [Gaiellaceae bacterium]